MKKTIKRLLPVVIVTLVLVVAFAVTAFATDDWMGTVTLLDMSQSGVEKSGYSDIDGNSAWTQVASPTVQKSIAYKDANFYWGWNFYAYYNSSTKTIVFMPSTANTMSARNNTAGVQIGEANITNTEGIDERFYAEKWAGANQYAYYAYSFQTWLDDNGAGINHVEFRPFSAKTGTKPVITEQFGAYIVDDLKNIKTVKMTADFTFRTSSNAIDKFNRIFAYKPELTTIQLGTFANTGSFAADTPANAVALTEGPTTGDTRYGFSGVIFHGCTSITRVILKTNSQNFNGLRDNMFNSCESLQFVYIDGTMSESYQVGTDAFKGCSDVNVYVSDVAAATAFAGIDNITLKNHTAYDADMKDYFSKNAPIYAEGVLAKIADTASDAGESVAIRFVFKWDAAGTLAMGTPVKVGVVACAASYYDSVVGGTEAEKLVALLADTNEVKVKKDDIAVYNDGNLSLVGRFLADGTDVENGVYSYAYTLFGIPEANYDSEIYAATYIQWADGTYSVASNSYTDATDAEKNTISLYDVTLGLFKRGLINSEKVADKYLWDVIDGYSAYSHKMTKASDGGSNVEYFFFPDNLAGGYVLAYRAIEKYNEDGTLKGAIIPHNGNYWGAPAKLAASIPYNNETATFVVDHGITGVGGARIFGGPYSTTTTNTVLKTIVYPTGMSLSGGSHAFHMLSNLENVIWCHTDANGNYVPHMSDVKWNANAKQKDQLFDMRGFGSTVADSALSSNMSVYTNATIKINIVLASNSVANVQNTEKRNVWKES